VGDSFSDSNLGDNVYDTGGSVHDSISVIQVFAPENPTALIAGELRDGMISPSRNAHVALEILDVDPQAPTPTSQAVEYFEIVYTDWDHPAPERTLGIVAGDFDGKKNTQGTLDDEIALIWDKVWWVKSGDHYEAFFHVLDVEPDTVGFSISDHRNPDFISFGLPSFDYWYPYSAEIVLTAGDFDGDGREEIARTWPRGFDDYDWPDLYRNLEVLDWDNGAWSPPSSYELPNWSRHSYQDALAAGDINLDLQQTEVNLQDEIILFDAIYDNIRTYSFDSEQKAIQPGPSQAIAMAENVPILATGDFSGDSVRVGPPSYRVQTQMTSPEVFLNLPPMHRDILSGHGEIQIFNGAQATHSAGNTAAEQSTAESKRDWTLSTGLETSVGSFGSTVSTSFGNTYGENFSKSTTQINTTEFQDTTTAEYYDQVIYNGTNYAIWEYPVHGVPGNGQDEAHAISVVFPLVETTNQPVTEQGRLCDEDFYAPNHQTYNVWSYDPLGTAEDFDDYHSLIESKQTSGGTDFSVSMSAVEDESRSASFHNQVSAGLEYSYENELNVPLIGKVWDFSFRAYMDGSYGHEEMSTLRTSFTEESAVEVDFPSIPDPSNYAIKTYLYWAEAGYLVMDYQTQPTAAGSWLLYTKPDPAFILPWYGFPDPDTGVFPPPPDPDAPPCGFDMQLFTHDIELDPSYVQNGDTVTMTATVRNFSNVNPDGNVTVAFYLSDPAAGSPIGSCLILELDRDLGPQSCFDTWTVSGGSGEEKVYAVIDPGNDFDEMHDADDVIDNNVGYGLLYVASADYFDPGLRQTQAYQAIPHDDAPGLGFHLYLPTKNISETVRYELVPTSSGDLRIVGNPIQVLAFRGGEEEPEEGHIFGPIPADIMALYRDSDLLPGMDEGNLKLYRLDGSGWVEATCPGYQIHRFPEDNLVAVPVCKTGTFVLSDESPTQFIYLPVVLRSH